VFLPDEFFEGGWTKTEGKWGGIEFWHSWIG